jgi:hypothetical protein
MHILLKRTDVGRTFEYKIRNEDDSIPNLSNALVRFKMGDRNNFYLDNPAVIVDSLTGIVSYTFKDEDTLVAGTYMSEFEVEFYDSEMEEVERVITYPRHGYINVSIQKNIDLNSGIILLDMVAKKKGEFQERLDELLNNFSTYIDDETFELNSLYAEAKDAAERVETAIAKLTVDSEIIDARGGYSTLGKRLSDMYDDIDAGMFGEPADDEPIVDGGVF